MPFKLPTKEYTESLLAKRARGSALGSGSNATPTKTSKADSSPTYAGWKKTLDERVTESKPSILTLKFYLNALSDEIQPGGSRTMPETVKQAVDSLSADLDNEVDRWYWFDRGEDGDEDPIPMYRQEKLLKLRTSLRTVTKWTDSQPGGSGAGGTAGASTTLGKASAAIHTINQHLTEIEGTLDRFHDLDFSDR
jgi:hypothetical protein